MQREAFGLAILFVPIKAEPAQAIEDRGFRGVRVAADIGIVDAQDHGAAGMTGEQPVEDIGARTPNVQKSRGRRRKTDSMHGNTILPYVRI